jgi:hypothetical protein
MTLSHFKSILIWGGGVQVIFDLCNQIVVGFFLTLILSIGIDGVVFFYGVACFFRGIDCFFFYGVNLNGVNLLLDCLFVQALKILD